jgi:GntR family transcriptional regulator, vanillate catabolism transcriptional regulator
VSQLVRVLPVAQRARLGDEVTQRLRDMILSNRLAPGTPLRQTELAEQLGISRTPLREALRVLEYDGLLTVSNRNGTVQVVSVSLENLYDMFQVREVVDGLAAKLLARIGPSKQTLSELRRYHSRLADSESPYDPAMRTEAHARLHALIAEACGNPYVASFSPLIRMSSAWLRHPLVSEPSATSVVDNKGMTRSLGESMIISDRAHAEIVDAIEERNSRRAGMIASRHIRGTMKGIQYWISMQQSDQNTEDAPRI